MPKGTYKHQPLSEEHKKKLSKAHTGLKHTEETKRKMKISAKKGNENPAKRLEVKKKISEAHKGKTLSKEHKEKLSEAKKGKSGNALGKHWKLSKETVKKMSRENSPHWLGGKSFEPYTIDWTQTLKKSIRERDRYTCQLCGKEPALCCHHIDYNKKNCNPNNLIILCGNCHAKTNSNREYWINYFNE